MTHVPIELCLDVPRKKYTKTGKKAMYIPTIGGTLPNIAYAIPMRKLYNIDYVIIGTKRTLNFGENNINIFNFFSLWIVMNSTTYRKSIFYIIIILCYIANCKLWISVNLKYPGLQLRILAFFTFIFNLTLFSSLCLFFLFLSFSWLLFNLFYIIVIRIQCNIPCGICITATVIPATTSPKMLFFQSYEESQSIRGIVLFKSATGLMLLHRLAISLRTTEL